MTAIDYTFAHLAFLPSNNLTDLKFITLPHPRTSCPTNYILHESQLYEIKLLDQDNPHDPQNHLRATTKGDDLPVRSLILSNVSDPEKSLIIEDGALVLSSKFNLSYVLISYFTSLAQKDFNGGRYEALEDIIERLSETYGEETISALPESLIQTALAQVTDNIVEGDEPYYRYSTDKILKFLKAKVDNLSQNYPPSITEKLIKPSLLPLDLDQEIPSEILTCALQKSAISLLSSYLNSYWTAHLISQYSFTSLDKYIKDLNEEKAKKKLAEEQIHDVNALNAANRRDNAKGARAPASGKKAPVKKVAAKPKISKGPLDSFFGKKN